MLLPLTIKSMNNWKAFPIYDNEIFNNLEKYLEEGLDPDTELSDNILPTPLLHNACKIGSFQKASLLLKFGANPNKKNASGETPLMVASENGELEIIKLLLDQPKTLIDEQDNYGYTALMHALGDRWNSGELYYYEINKDLRRNVTLTLLKAKSDPYITNNKRQNAIDLARKNGYNNLATLMENYKSIDT